MPVGNWGGGAKYFFSAPKFPPSLGKRLEVPDVLLPDIRGLLTGIALATRIRLGGG